MMVKKQVAFNLDEELHRRLHMLALQRNTSVKDLMENIVEQILRGGHALKPRLLLAIQEKINSESGQIKEALHAACLKSLRLDANDEDTVVQVIIDEFGEIRDRESQKGLIPNSVLDQKAYILAEFSCVDVLQLYYEGEMFNESDWYEPLKAHHQEFAKWLKRNGYAEPHEYEDSAYDDSEDVVGQLLRKYSYKENGTIDYSDYLNLVYKWNPKVYRELKTFILSLVKDSYVMENRVETAWNELIQRDELGL